MALAAGITAVEYEALTPAIKEHYKLDGDKASLDVTGGEDVGALKRAKDHEKAERKKEKERADAAEAKVTELEGSIATGKPDLEAVKKSYETKAATDKQKADAEIARRDKFIEKTLKGTAAITMATEVSTTPKLLAKEIESRLSVDFSGDEPALVILDSTGKPDPAKKLDDLKKEVVDNPDYAAIITGSKASGSGATGAGRGGNGGGATKKLADMNEAERTDFAKRDPEGFKTASAEAHNKLWNTPLV